MNLLDLIRQDIQISTASVSGAAASMLAPVSDILTRIVIGVVTGLIVLSVSKLAKLVWYKIKKAKCDCDSCKEE